MGANVSRQKAAGYVMRQSVASYLDWDLLARCDYCERETRMALRPLAAKNPEATISDMVSRLICAGCKRRPGRVMVEKGRRGVIITGPGSY